jgi:hypothetical protein
VTPWTTPPGLFPREPYRSPACWIYAPAPGQRHWIAVGSGVLESRMHGNLREDLLPFVNGGAYKKHLEGR